MKKFKLSLLSLLLVLGLVVVFKPVDVQAKVVSTPKAFRGLWVRPNLKKKTLHYVQIEKQNVLTGSTSGVGTFAVSKIVSCSKVGYSNELHTFCYRLKLTDKSLNGYKYHYVYVVRANYSGKKFITYSSTMKKLGSNSTLYANAKSYGF